MVIVFLVMLLCCAIWRKVSFRDDRIFSLRSGAWRRVRNEHLRENNFCVICGSRENLVVHHVQSFSEHPELELSSGNLVTLCENKNLNCHFVFGHRMRWNDLNRHLPETIEYMKRYLKS